MSEILPKTSTEPAAKPRGWLRRLLQFRLRTLMLLTVGAAIFTQWWLRPKPQEFKVGDYRVFKHVTVLSDAPGASGVPVGFGGGFGQMEIEVRDGAYWICDRDGRVLVRGAFDQNTPTGRWKAYHLNGRLASVGKCDERGGRAGVWKSWHPNGKAKLSIRYGPSRESEPWMEYADERISVREGPAKAWHDNGQLQWEGTYHDDQQHGDWTFYLPDGTVEAEGAYRAGRRHGAWKIRAADGEPAEQYFLDGEIAEDPALRSDDEIRELFASGNYRQQLLGLKLARFSERKALLLEAARSDDRTLALTALGAITRLGAAAAELGPPLKELAEQRADPHLQAAALAARFAVDKQAREAMIQRAVSGEFTPKRRRQLAAALARQGFDELSVFDQRLRSQNVAESRFALQVLLWSWSELRNSQTYEPNPARQDKLAHQILVKSTDDESVPEPIRGMIQQWVDATYGGKGGGFSAFGGASFF